MILAVGAFLLLALAIGPIVSLAQASQLPAAAAQPATAQLVNWLTTMAPAFFAVSAFILLYRTMPRTRVGRTDVWLGGLIAGLDLAHGQGDLHLVREQRGGLRGNLRLRRSDYRLLAVVL